jgi:hypothetical protein
MQTVRQSKWVSLDSPLNNNKNLYLTIKMLYKTVLFNIYCTELKA